MDNQLPSPNMPAGAERPSGPAPEQAPKPALGSPEAAPAGAERPAAASAASGAPVIQPPALSAADVAAAIAATPTVGAAPGAATPAMAGDVDVIEPEWVDKAEGVIRAHQGDPYGEEEAIEVLQKDYLQKRYGINVANPNPGDTKSKGA